jgi:hypothetical protein
MFNETRRMKCTQGPYYVGRGGMMGQDHDDPGIIEYNWPPDGQPGLWCQWVSTKSGDGIEWDGGEKFYEATAWMAYLIDHFLKPGAHASRSGDPQFEDFTFDHVVNGEIEASGEESGDLWMLVVKDNVVSTARGQVVYQ